MKKLISATDFFEYVASALVALVLILALLGSGGCEQIPVERTYSASYNADSQSGSIGITLRPVTPPRGNEGQAAVNAMNDETILRILKLVETEMAKNRAPAISLTQEVNEIPQRTLGDK